MGEEEMALIKCPKCGQEISDKAKKCIHCGNVLTDETAVIDKIKCSNCGNSISDDDHLVWKCTSCNKAFKVSLLKLKKMYLQKSKPEYAGKMLLKCPTCGNWMDDGNEKIAYKCPVCENVMTGNLKYFGEEKQAVSNMIICPECGKEIGYKADECPYCGCPIEKTNEQEIISVKKESRSHFNQWNRIIIPIVAVVVCVIIGMVVYGVKIVKPQNTYNEAVALLETGKYEQANELFDTIQNYKDVSAIQEQLKYESYAYSCINSLKKYLKNPDSYQPYEIKFYSSTGGEKKSIDSGENEISEEVEDDKLPTCIMHYGAQNGFGGNTTGYAIFSYDSDNSQYELLGTCDSLDKDDYDKDDEDDVYDLFICGIINLYRDGGDTIGSVDLGRLKVVLKNDAYSTIKIIE